MVAERCLSALLPVTQSPPCLVANHGRRECVHSNSHSRLPRRDRRRRPDGLQLQSIAIWPMLNDRRRLRGPRTCARLWPACESISPPGWCFRACESWQLLCGPGSSYTTTTTTTATTTNRRPHCSRFVDLLEDPGGHAQSNTQLDAGIGAASCNRSVRATIAGQNLVAREADTTIGPTTVRSGHRSPNCFGLSQNGRFDTRAHITVGITCVHVSSLLKPREASAGTRSGVCLSDL